MNREQLKQLEDDLWSAADNLRANSDLKASEYSTPVLGLIFLKFADINYRRHEAAILKEYQKLKGGRREKSLNEIAVARCGFYLPDHARYSHLLNLPESQDIAKAIEKAMEAIEEYKPELQGSLPKDGYYRLTRTGETEQLPFDLLRQFDNIPDDASGDVFGQIYEYFLGKFALAEGQGGGEFFTPRSVVRLMVEIIEPHGGTVFDPACGSGGMFVQSAQFIERHREEFEAQGEDTSVFVSGQEKSSETVKLARMNLAVNGLRGQILQGISYYDDHFGSFGKFDYVLANPPFNVDEVSLSGVEKDPRFNTYGIPRKKTKAKKSEQGKETVPNANYLWINLFATSLREPDDKHPGGRAALVMANSASDARHSEADIRRTLIENNLIYGMLTLPSNMFYTVTLPATLWFFDKGKTDERILFIDARNIFTPIDRAHREFSEEQIQNIAIISRLHKGRRDEFIALIDRYFEQGMARLVENRRQVEPVAEQLLAVLDDEAGKKAVASLVDTWKGLAPLQKAWARHRAVHPHPGPLPAGEGASEPKAEIIDQVNEAQQTLRASFDPFFTALHDSLKQIDKAVRRHEKTLAEASKQAGKRQSADRATRQLKATLEELHKEVKNAESSFGHIHWLQERFPEAKYEDVTGLCKLADLAEVKEQDYSLNPGRYVGVVIEEDGKTEEEFMNEIAELQTQLQGMSNKARRLEDTISKNVAQLVADDTLVEPKK
ncbi:Site-specific DNA-methyltransferase (adenine-specific) [Nitrosococcus halophilus Nc 4]|uniref:site-specific DNA-methyltransferase (adenine-specific) n=1 Tax=Nitrosococcus halophilus (strain Nc4) TaxID=472759 RepID=D5C3X0_NITHN|nr:class I SAM-dependent DNA methyltransferase [Nitrosococcus halophilus]ADE15092.1 Site-specific DNA-methyltransferase (adenine-specific) [Nitrosococcus halophilus Nc 4]